MHAMFGFLAFVVAVILIARHWRIFRPIVIVGVVLGGLFLAAFLGLFAAPPTHEQIVAACVFGTGFNGSPRSRYVSDAECEQIRHSNVKQLTLEQWEKVTGIR